MLYSQTGGDISIVKASGHGLGYLYPPKDGFDKDADALKWVVEAWNWLLRNELGLPSQEPAWLDYPAMMRMTLTSPNVMRKHRPEWLSPFNFFFLPLLSDLGGYPAGCNRSNFKFITQFSSNRRTWKKLTGVNICDGRNYRMEMFPNSKQDKVVPESFRIILRLYLRHPESKSLAPAPCWIAAEAGGSYLFCDTDSLCIVSNERGGLVPCPGGEHKLADGREAVKVLSRKEVENIAGRFNKLNPFNRSLVPEILKIEDINFVDSDPHKPRRQLFSSIAHYRWRTAAVDYAGKERGRGRRKLSLLRH